ncbi:MAG: cupin domain-containing protein [Gemmataceae bacterium]|nr:cupin domain-containing protein [Gemmataceae bacterium]
MRHLTTDVLRGLLTGHEPPCISLYQPTHRANPDNLQGPIRYKNLVRDAERSLREKFSGREVKAGGEDTGGAFALIEVLVPPQSGPPPHVHRREDEAFYVLEGEFEVHIDGQRLTAGPGSWVTLAKGSLHHFKNVSATAAKMLILAMPAGLDQFFLEAGREATDTSPESGALRPEDTEKLLAVAPKYGIEIELPPS